jgi:hypothetical protein
MRKLLTFLIALGAVAFAVATPSQAAWIKSAQPFESYLQPVGYFLFFNRPTYTQGPGDIIPSGWQFWGSCARAFKLSLANTSTSMCDLQQGPSGASPGTAVGTLRASASGFVDLSAYFAGSVTPVAACAAITGGCVVSQLYDQATGVNATQATNSKMPPLIFSALNGLPVINFPLISPVDYLETQTNTSTANPITYSVVAKRLGLFSALSGIIGANNLNNYLGGGNGTATVTLGSSGNLVTASDSTWHGLQALQTAIGGATCFINVDGVDSSGLTCSNIPFATSKILIGESNGAEYQGEIAEVGMLAATTTSTQRGNLFTNQNSTSGYNGAL